MDLGFFVSGAVWGARFSPTPRRYDLARLAADAGRAAALQAFDRGAYGHAVSLPAAEQLDERFRDHPNNRPFADCLGACPSLREVFEELAAPKAPSSTSSPRGRTPSPPTSTATSGSTWPSSPRSGGTGWPFSSWSPGTS